MTATDLSVPEETDLLVVGSGIAGMTGALAAAAAGLRAMVVEKADVLGGNTALSGGLMWIPNNPLLAEDGVADSAQWAHAYLDSVIGDAGPASSPERRAAFVDHGPAMITFLRAQGLRLERCTGYSDYYPEHPGGMPEGRSVRGAAFDLRRLGKRRTQLRQRQLFPGVPIHMEEVSPVGVASRTLRGAGVTGRIVGRALGGLVRGKKVDTLGASLMGQALFAVARRGIPLHTNLGLRELTTADGRVTGALLARPDGGTVRVRTRAVLLACGGFSYNEAMRKEHGPQPACTDWTMSNPADTGDGITAGQAVGGAVALMDEAIWMGTGVRPDGTREMHVFDRSLPHSIVVDSSGSRFVNEATDYARFGQAIYRRHQTVPAVPSWFVLDSRHRRRYSLGDVLPGITPRSLVRDGYVRKADTLDELARQCDIDPAGLRATVQRFNAMAAAGRDADFHRGESFYDRYFSDPTQRPNPNLGAIDKPPFYAVSIYPGDVGTTGGLLTDEHARLLSTEGAVIPGVYAAGNCSATVMGRAYPGPGASIGGAATFGYIAARHLAAS